MSNSKYFDVYDQKQMKFRKFKMLLLLNGSLDTLYSILSAAFVLMIAFSRNTL